MKDIKALFSQIRKGPSDVVGVDFNASGIYGARVRRGDPQPLLVAAERFDWLPLAEAAQASAEPSEKDALQLIWSRAIRARYACVTVPGETAVVKLISLPGEFDAHAEAGIIETMGLRNPEDYRVGYKVLIHGKGRSESKVLGVALEEPEAARTLAAFASGIPAPYSLELSGLAALTAVRHAIGSTAQQGAVAIVDFGARVSTLGLFNRGLPVLVRRSLVCEEVLQDRVQVSLGIDPETARKVLEDGSFDVSHTVAEVLSPLVAQIAVSRDFVERRENCRLEKIYLLCNPLLSRHLTAEIQGKLGESVDMPDPTAGFNIAEQAVPEELRLERHRLAPCLGACLASLEIL